MAEFVTQKPVYEMAVTTDRLAEMLACKHGFENVAHLARALPAGARVLDVGAGASPFGKEVAQLRQDIHWVNFDYSYQDAAILEDVRQDAPANVEYVFGDATQLAEMYGPASFDAVFSYWLLPHLSIDDRRPARQAARAIFTITKPGGLMSVGPETSQSWLPRRQAGNAIQVVKDERQDGNGYADRIVALTELSGLVRYAQGFINGAATSFFGTTRYSKRGEGVPQVFDPRTDEYTSVFSWQGARTIGGLALALVRYAATHRHDSST